MYQALYRRCRPETFEGILGQEHIVKILKNQLASEAAGHAYLFCGTRGTGKTSTARILAKGVNCTAEPGQRPCGTCPNCVSIREGTFLDVIEIDAASNNGVENIRELRESVKYPPAVGRCKVYIIDEVHMLSTGAFNALLKTLEEPPENVMFILATTEPQKLPATILSRCLRLDFRRVSEKRMKEGLREICSGMDVKISEAALGLIASNADGSVRDGLSLLDQCISGGGDQITRQDVLEFLGTAGEEVFLELTKLVAEGRVGDALILLSRLLADGKDVRQLMKDWIGHYRSLLMTKYLKNPEDVLNLSEENAARIRGQSETLDLAQINCGILELSRTLTEAKWSTQPRILLELCIVKLAEGDGAWQSSSGPGGGRARIRQTAVKEGPVQAAQDLAGQAEQGGQIDDSNENSTGAQHRESVIIEADEPTGSSEPRGTGAPKDADLSRIWQRVFEDGEAAKGSFNLLRGGATLTEITENEFFVEAGNPVVLRFAKENAQLLEELMEKHTGVRRKLVCGPANSGEEKAKQTSMEELAGELEKRLGLNVELK